MNNKVIVAVVALVLLLGIGGFFIMGQNKSSVKTTGASPTPAQNANSTSNKSLVDILALNQNLRCGFNVKGSTGGGSEGTFYVSNGKVRGDFTVTSKDGKEEKMSMIRDGDTNYIWGSSLPTGGIKMTLALDEMSANDQASQYVNPTQKTDYNCITWNVDASLFTPPANVKFTDITSMMPKTTGTGTQTGTGPCSQITDAGARAACESAIQQNGQY